MASSTSNFDPLFPKLKRLPQIWLGAAVLVCCFTAFVTLSRFSWFFDPTSFEKRLAIVQEQAISTRPNPRIVILGTSRAAFGLASAVIEHVLQQPPLSVANWSYPSFEIDAYEKLVETNKDKIARADLVVIGIDEYFALSPKTSAPAQEPDIVTRNWAFDIDQAIRTYVATVIPVTKKMAWFRNEFGGRLFPQLIAPFRLKWKQLGQLSGRS